MLQMCTLCSEVVFLTQEKLRVITVYDYVLIDVRVECRYGLRAARLALSALSRVETPVIADVMCSAKKSVEMPVIHRYNVAITLPSAHNAVVRWYVYAVRDRERI